MKKETESTFINKIWDFFTSVKLAIIIFACISLISIIGTIVEQQAEPDKNIALLAKFFGDSAAPTVYNIFAKLGFMDMYRSWWYITLLVFLALNIIICSFDRLPRVLKNIREPLRPLRNEQIERMVIKRSILLNGKPEGVKDTVSIALKKAGFNIGEIKEDKGYQFYSQKGSWSKLGIYITHLSILVILSGAIFGMLFSVESFISLPEGDTSPVTYPIPGSGKFRPIPLGFEIRCDNFEVEFYRDTDTPKSFKSEVSIIQEGKEVLRKTIKVNDPLTYKGTTFYLSDYGTVERRLNRGTFIFRVTSRDGQTADVRLRPGDTLRIPNTQIIGKILNFSPALTHDEEGKLTTYTDDLNNPAVHIDFSEPRGRQYSSWIFKRLPETSLLPDGNRVEFLDYWGVEYAFLRIRKDPSVWLVYVGLIIMGIGLLIAFFMSHKKIWVILIEEEMNTKVTIGATANKNRDVFEKKINRMINTLSHMYY